MLVHGILLDLYWLLKFITMMMILFLVLLLLAENKGPYFIEVNPYWKEGEHEEEEQQQQPREPKDQTFEDDQIASPGSVRVHGACSFCGKLSTITKRCSRCKTALYCSAVCHVIHWRLWHKYECIEIETAADQETPTHATSKLLINHPQNESSCSSDEDGQITDVGEAEYVEKYAEQPTDDPRAKLLVGFSQEATEKPQETAEQVKSLMEELAKFKNENISLQSERENWEMGAKEAADKLHSFMKESENQLLILKHKKELISNAEKQARGMVRSLSERLHCLQSESAKAKRELQEERECVRRLTLERDQATQFATRLAEETGQKLLNALNAVAAAESRATATEVVRTEKLSRNSSFHNKQACAICLSNEKDMAFGCGHMTCRDCGSRISKCPICREKIRSRVKLFPG